jgi:hypothetical protein
LRSGQSRLPAMTDESNELKRYLRKLTERTQNGDMEWRQQAPTSFQWTQMSKDAPRTVTLQKATDTTKIRLGSRSFEVEYVYLLQVISASTRQTLLSLSSKERPDLGQDLAALYAAAESGVDVQAARVLKQLLGE